MSGLIVIVDDLRSFVDKRECVVLRTAQDAKAWLKEHQDERIDELWLDHDLGFRSESDIGTVLELLEEAAVNGKPYDIGTVYAHSANPYGRNMVIRALERHGYAVENVSLLRSRDVLQYSSW